MPAKKKETEDSQEEHENIDQDGSCDRQDLYVVFTHDRELRNVEQVKIKISQFTGIVVRIKSLSIQSIENLLNAIELDAHDFQCKQIVQNQSKNKKSEVVPIEMGGLAETIVVVNPQPTSGIVNLRFEECTLPSKAVIILKNFLIEKQLLETFYIQKVEFQESINDFKQLIDGLQQNIKIRKAGIISMLFDEESYGKTLQNLLYHSKQLRELDLSQCEFYHPKSFFDFCQALVTDKSRINNLKLKGLNITSLEAKIIQLVLMKNKSLHTLDLSNTKIDSGQSLEFIFQKMDKNSMIRYFILDNCQSDLSNSIEIFGEALNENTKIEALIMRENKIKWVPYSNFWENLKNNTSLLKINLSKTELSDRVVENMCAYISNPQNHLSDLDISRNLLTDIGLSNLSEALINNTKLNFLNLSQNYVKDVGLKPLVTYLSASNCGLIELSLMGNKINNEGIQILSEFIKPNSSLKMLDISKNLYSDSAFDKFAAEMGESASLTFLDISKSRELNDEGSLITLAKQIEFNTCLQTLDLSGVRVRKPFLTQFMVVSLKRNITLKYVHGKHAPDAIDEQLNINILIQAEVEPNYQPITKYKKNQVFDVHLVDPECNSYLCMKDKDQSLFDAAFKFIQRKEVRQVDLSNMNLQDAHLYHLAAYLLEIPNLRSLILNENKQITDDGIFRLAQSLCKNNKLAHLSLLKCPQLTNKSFVELNRVLSDENMMLCQLDFDQDKKRIDVEVANQIKQQCDLNRNIQEFLKPVFQQKDSSQEQSIQRGMADPFGEKQNSTNTSNQVRFIGKVRVNKSISAAIKCWKISTPIIIQIENQKLNDKNVVELCQFLKDRNMIVNLNLRRNRITNLGANVIINWIVNHDKALTQLDVSRNRITKIGAQSFLTALKKLIRIVDFQISYGNPIPIDISLAIQQEIIANNQIQANKSQNLNGNFNNNVVLTSGKYELIDRGPNFMRCATKSIELLKIQHLSLPDNMLGFQEAKMLTAMIKLNPPLKTLNLENNNLDARCSKLIAQALKTNSNLQLLNISKNKLSDLGIICLLQSLIKARLSQIQSLNENNTYTEPNITRVEPTKQNMEESQMSIKRLTSKTKPQIIEQNDYKGNNSQQKQNLAVGITQRNSKNLFKNTVQEQEQIDIENQEVKQFVLSTEEIEICDMGQIKFLNITDNMSTLESYKAIQTLLTINQQIVIYFDSPKQLRSQQKQQKQFQDLYSRQIKQMQQQILIQEEEGETIIEQNKHITEIENLIKAQDSIQDEQLSDEETEPIVKSKQIVSIQNNDGNENQSDDDQSDLKRFFKFLCCFKKEEISSLNHQQDLNQITLQQVVFWFYHKRKYLLMKFDPNIEEHQSFEESSIQQAISTILVLNQILLYLVPITCYFISGINQFNAIVSGSYLVYLILFELIVLIITRSTIKFALSNVFLWVKIFSGILNKAPLLSLGLIGSICVKSQNSFGYVIASLTLFSILIDQVKVVRDMILIWKINDNSVMPLLDRTQRLCQLLSYQGINVVYQKISLLPSKNSELFSEKIVNYLYPDLVKNPAVGFFNKMIEFITINYNYNTVARHLLFQNITLIIVVIISLTQGWAQLTQAVSTVIAVCVLDSIQCIMELTGETKVIVSLNADKICEIATERNLILADRYKSVLMREKEFNFGSQKQNQKQNSEGSILETKEDNSDRVQLLSQNEIQTQSQAKSLIGRTNQKKLLDFETLHESKSILNNSNSMSVTQELDPDNVNQD